MCYLIFIIIHKETNENYFWIVEGVNELQSIEVAQWKQGEPSRHLVLRRNKRMANAVKIHAKTILIKQNTCKF